MINDTKSSPQSRPDDDHQADGSAMPMPPDRGDSVTTPNEISPPPSAGRQLAQLILIPAVIVCAAVAIVYPIARMAGSRATVDEQLATLDRSEGLTNDRWHAAYRLAQLIPTVKDDPQVSAKLNTQLIKLLARPQFAADDKTQRFLLSAIALLKQPGNLDVLLDHADSSHPQVRHAVVVALRQWHDPVEARGAIDHLLKMLSDENIEIRGFAASALGQFADRGDRRVIDALIEAMDQTQPREVAWDIAIALAKLGEPKGSRIVAGLLLDRGELAQLVAEGGRGPNDTLPLAEQDRIMVYTLTAVSAMTDEQIWSKIGKIAATDTNSYVRTAAKAQLTRREAVQRDQGSVVDN